MSDNEGQFSEGVGKAGSGRYVGPEIVEAAAQVLDEGVTGDDDRGGTVSLQPSHRSKPGLQAGEAGRRTREQLIETIMGGRVPRRRAAERLTRHRCRGFAVRVGRAQAGQQGTGLLAKIVIFGRRIDFMGWLTAIGTAGAVGVALGLALLNRFGRRKAARWYQAEQLTGWLGFGVVVGPLGPLRGKAHTPRKGTHTGNLVWVPGVHLDWKEGGWTDGKRFFRTVMLQNGSQQVVYRVIVALVNDPHGGGKGQLVEPRTLIGEVPPGLTKSVIEILDGMDRPKIEIAFVDASNRPWIRWQDGTLRELDQDPPEHYGMTELLGSDWG